MKAKYAGRCSKCSLPINVGQEISWNRRAEQGQSRVYHVDCATAFANTPEVDIDVPETTNKIDRNGPPANDLASLIAAAIQEHIQMPDAQLDESRVREIVQSEISGLKSLVPWVTTIELINYASDTIQNLGVQHHTFPLLLKVLSAKLNVWLAGPAGSGKTTAAHECAKALGLQFRFCGAQSNEYGLLGFITANGSTVRTPFREAYEHGGVFLFDEVDSSSPAAVLAFNAALANGLCAFPDAVVTRHPDFVCVAAANTFGLGGTNDYVGRTKQDAAFLDRFVTVNWDIDGDLESATCGNPAWAKKVQKYRDNVKAKGIKVVISPRASYFGARLLAQGLSEDTVKNLVIRKGLSDDQWESIQ